MSDRQIVLLERKSMGEDIDMSCLNAFGRLTMYDNVTDPNDIIEKIRHAHIVVVNKAPMRRESLEGVENLELICVLATGFDNCDAAYCRQRGIAICNAVNYSTAMVAQHTVTLALALSQKLAHYDRYVKAGEYSAQRGFANFDAPFREMDGKTWGIVGMGNIGSRVAKIAEALGCRVICHSLTGRSKAAPYPRVDKETLLKQSDVLSLHCPLSDLSRRFIDADALRQMKKTAYLINVARGPVVDQHALYEALAAGEIGGAGLDVMEKEPLPADDPLLTIKDSGRLIITPHLACASVEARERCVGEVCENIRAFVRGEARNVVN